jgi:hypothetical protein
VLCFKSSSRQTTMWISTSMSGRRKGRHHREWLIPAAIVNRARVELADDAIP